MITRLRSSDDAVAGSGAKLTSDDIAGPSVEPIHNPRGGADLPSKCDQDCDSDQNSGDNDSDAAGHDLWWCWSCFRPLIPGVDNLAILTNAQIRMSYRLSGIYQRYQPSAPLTSKDRLHLSAKHLLTGAQHLLFALRLLVIRQKNFAIRVSGSAAE